MYYVCGLFCNKTFIFSEFFFQSFSHKCQELLIKECPSEFISFLCECIINVIAGKLKIKKVQVARYERQMHRLAQKKPSMTERRIILSSNKGLSLIRIIAPNVVDRFACQPEEN